MDRGENFTFHYDPEERLKKHPELRDFHEMKMTPQRGFFRVLVANPSGRFLLVAIAALSATIFARSFWTKGENFAVVAGSKVFFDAFSRGNDVFLALTFENEGFSPSSEDFSVEFCIFDGDGKRLDKKNIKIRFGDGVPKAEYKFSNAEAAASALATIFCGDEEKIVHAKIKK